MKVVNNSLFLIILIFANILFAQEKTPSKPKIRYYTLKYVIKKNDEFHSILAKYLRPELPVRAYTNMVRLTRRENPHIKDWKLLKENNVIVLFMSPDHIAWDDIQPEEIINFHTFPPSPLEEGEYLANNPGVKLSFPTEINSEKDENELQAIKKPTTKWGAVLSRSEGTFREVTSDITTKAVTNQSSPITFGINMNYKVNDDLQINSSAYYSIISSISDDLGTIYQIPAELGINTYFETKVFKSFSPFLGLDYENFSAFSAQQFQADSSIAVKTFSLGFLTLGVSKLFEMGKRNIITRVSFSKSLLNTASDKTNTYNGEKIILSLKIPLSDSLSFTTFYKKHYLKGDSILSIDRYGFGLAYDF